MIKDLHSHILYGIDDGSKTIEESIVLLKEMEKAGTKELILTPHYIENSKYNANNKSKEALFRQLKKKVKELSFNLSICALLILFIAVDDKTAQSTIKFSEINICRLTGNLPLIRLDKFLLLI